MRIQTHPKFIYNALKLDKESRKESQKEWQKETHKGRHKESQKKAKRKAGSGEPGAGRDNDSMFYHCISRRNFTEILMVMYDTLLFRLMHLESGFQSGTYLGTVHTLEDDVQYSTSRLFSTACSLLFECVSSTGCTTLSVRDLSFYPAELCQAFAEAHLGAKGLKFDMIVTRREKQRFLLAFYARIKLRKLLDVCRAEHRPV